MCFEKYRRNIFKWGLVLKVSSKEIQLCNWNLNLIYGLRTTIFLSFEVVCTCRCYRGGGGPIQAVIRYRKCTAVIKSLPNFYCRNLHSITTIVLSISTASTPMLIRKKGICTFCIYTVAATHLHVKTCYLHATFSPFVNRCFHHPLTIVCSADLMNSIRLVE